MSNPKIILSKDVHLPLMDYATQATGVLGTKGSGKSYSSTMLGEQLMENDIPITALDPAGVWRFLKVPGAGKGFPVVVVGGGEQQDLPLDPHTIEDITRAAMKSGVSLVVDLFTSRPSKETIRQVVLKCVQTMFYENVGVRHVFIEEAAEVAPQRVMAEHGRVYAAIEQLVRVGGNCSLGVTIINQRAEDVNKAILELCDFMFLHRQRGRNSLKNLEDWFRKTNMTDESVENVIATTMRLDSGQCWFMSKDAEEPVLLKMPAKQSFHPDRQKPEITAKAVKRVVNVEEWVEKLKKALPKPEEKKPAVAAKAAAPVPAPAPIIKEVEKIVEVPILTDADRQLLSGVRDYLEKAVPAVQALITKADSALLAIKNRPQLKPAPLARPVLHRTHAPTASPNGSQDQTILSGRSGVRRMLMALAQRQPLTRSQLGMRAQVSPNGGSFDTYVSKAVMNGWIRRDSSSYFITQDGVNALGDFDPLPTGRALLDHYLQELGASGSARMLKSLAEAYPGTLTRAELGALSEVSPEGGSFDTYVSRLATLELISKDRGTFRASEEFFE